MRRWCCSSAAAGLTRRFLSSSSAVAHARPLVPSLPFRLHHSHAALPLPLGLSFRSIVRPPVTAMAMQVRHYAIKGRSRAPITPTISKVKKYKMKAPS